ncbi:MAG: peptidoglycan DD-metalloendopeptidase family protein [Gammaproteobacteria bacterium]|jgi:lipoprotein NlpD|nr:peptidoglycan DD-metalloendopeptidase family protein [Gammaproteobacteria bacterium]
MWQRLLCCTLVLTVAGCTTYVNDLFNQDAAPVFNIGNDTPVTHGIHQVQPGESLYEIAWRYGRDYRDIAEANHISAPYVIYPGQKINLRAPKRSANTYATRVMQPQKRVAQNENPKPSIPTQAKITSSKSIDKSSVTSSTFKNEWQWPVKGKIIKHYLASGVGLKGIDIAGDLGKEVKSAGSGKVVYSGQGLRGYGQLVIIKHNDTYLSAYGHNSELLVKEGQTVTKGQVIARMGHTDTDTVKLHFEVRKNGRPINPLDVLPAA